MSEATTKPIKNPPLKYHGGKNYLAKWLHSLAPPSVQEDPDHGYTHRNIVFFGGGGEFWNWLPVDGISEAVNDANGRLINFFAVLSSPFQRELLINELQLTLFSGTAWREARDSSEIVPESPELSASIHGAKAFFIKYRQSRQGLGKDYATPTTRTRRGMNENVSAWLSAIEGLPEAHERLQRVEVRNLDCLEFIRKYDHPRALFYCDPPYLHGTRSSTGEYGKHEMSEEDHEKLLATLAGIKGKFMLSGYHSELYDCWANETHGFPCHEREIDNKASSKKKKPKKTECLWTNF